uniref:ATP synthase F0 subunit 8 n=1 Tax=Ptychadena erlangeri TaxID=1342833 RepID=UPI00286AE0F1|nr:ATP synthase F0 subunit 8 [Ptychadena erlangeri]WKT10473.1 ATP synthase F0 subunit 8 [Ptychadena erlangeri]WKT10486.1 ATP synthase F0 subunit 8 [Ptychadena erlangeri]WKT10499.1 ATP synthase F0 subunit 8 [Ptychadena erlangeri]WKT10512.1 ATP synthase F0 subunit 8 [Ptychadena erlangeri]WKT10525.1 ATP synthase F0 subunit 8 [Ptychadena erlangeri]
MPQLVFEPWFYIFVLSWGILLLMAPNKILNHIYPNDFNPKTSKTGGLSWPWLWQ